MRWPWVIGGLLALGVLEWWEQRARERAAEERSYPRLTSRLSQQGERLHLDLEVAVGPRPLRILRLDASLGRMRTHRDFVRPQLEDSDEFTALGPVLPLLSTPLTLQANAVESFRCKLACPADLPPDRWASGAGWRTGEQTGVQVELETEDPSQARREFISLA